MCGRGWRWSPRARAPPSSFHSCEWALSYVRRLKPFQVAEQRAAKLTQMLNEVDSAKIEGCCFEMLRRDEAAAIPRRVKDAEGGTAAEAEAEELLQVGIRACDDAGGC